MLILEKLLILKSVSLFKTTPEPVLAEIARYTTEKIVAAGQTILHKNDEGNAMYVIVEGEVVIVNNGRTLAKLGARQFFGELAALSPEPRSADVRAVQDCLLLELSRKDLDYLMDIDSHIAKNIIQVLCQRLRAHNEAL